MACELWFFSFFIIFICFLVTSTILYINLPCLFSFSFCFISQSRIPNQTKGYIDPSGPSDLRGD